MQEGMDKFIPKQYAGCVTRKPLWMSYRALTAKISNIFIAKDFKNVYYMRII